MSVPFSVSFNQLGSVNHTGSPQTLYVTSSTPVDATFSQVYVGPSTANLIGESVTLLVKGTGRFTGTYTGTIVVTSLMSNLQVITTPPGNFTGFPVYFNNDVHILGTLFQGPPVFAPSPVRTLSNFGDATSWTLTYDPPAFTDGVNMTNTTALDPYKIVVDQNGAQAHSLSPATQAEQVFTTTDTYKILPVLPETPYFANVYAKNTANASYSVQNTYSFTTAVLPQPSFPGSLSVTVPSSSILNPFSNIEDGMLKNTSLILGTVTQITTTPTHVPLNNVATRGTLFFSCTLNCGGGTGTTYSSFTGGSYPSSNFGSNVLMTMGVSDQYAGVLGSAGYYGYANVIVRTTLTPSPYQQAVTIQDPARAASATFTYYYDGTRGSPSGGTQNTTFTPPPSFNICGVPCYHAGQTISFTSNVTGATNMGVYFQPQFPVVYKVLGAATGSFNATQRPEVNQTYTATIGSSYSAVFQVSSMLYNTVASANGPVFVYIDHVFDTPSYVQVQATSSLNPCTSGQSSQRVATPALTDVSTLGTFDNSVTLAAGELQLAAGLYSSYGETNAYKNYTPFGPDYSGLLTLGGARYATFAWSVPVGPRVSISITITGLPNADPGSTSDPLTFGGQPLQVLYRYHDPSNPPYNSSPPSFGSTWIRGNDTAGDFVSSTNYWDVTKSPYGFSSWSGSGGTYTLTVVPINSALPPSGALLYCMVGFTSTAMNSTLGFSGVTINSS